MASAFMTELSAQDRRAYQANIWKLYLLHFLMQFQLWWSIWVLYLQDMRGFSLTQIAVLEALFWGTAVVAQLPTGALADRFGRRTSLTLGAALTTVAVLVFGLATTYWIALASYLVWALAIAFLSGADYAVLFESLKALGREREFQGVAGRLGAVFSFAALAGGLLGAPIAAATNLSFPILLSAAIAAPGFLVALSLREPALPEGEMRLAYRSLLRESTRTAARTPTVRSMLVLSALFSAMTFGPMLFMQPFLTEHGVEIALVGFLQTPVRVAGIAGALAAAWATARLGTRGIFLATPLLMTAGYLLLGTWDAVYAFAAFPLVTLVNALVVPPATDYLNQRIPNNQRATVLSLRMMLTSLGAALLTPGLGVAADAISLRGMFLVSAIVTGATLSVAAGLWLRADLREGTEEETKVAVT